MLTNKEFTEAARYLEKAEEVLYQGKTEEKVDQPVWDIIESIQLVGDSIAKLAEELE